MVDTVRTEADLLTTLFQDGQGAGEITPQDIRDFVVSVKYLNNQGWNFVRDDTYTTGARRSVLAGVRTKVTIDGATENIGHPTANLFWNTTTNKLIPSAINDFGFVRLACHANSPVAATNHFTLELDVGGTYPIIYEGTAQIVKGVGVPQAFNFVIPLFAGTDFLANGGEFYITPESDAEFWDFALTSVKTYTAMVV